VTPFIIYLRVLLPAPPCHLPEDAGGGGVPGG